MDLSPLPAVLVEPVVRATLVEDLGRAGDITTDAIVPPGHRSRMDLVARQSGVVAGLDCARLAMLRRGFTRDDIYFKFDSIIAWFMSRASSDLSAGSSSGRW